MAALAMFVFKCPLTLDFDRKPRRRDHRPKLIRNLKALFGIGCVPSDTTMQERLDGIDPQRLRPVFKAFFARLRRGGGFKKPTQPKAAISWPSTAPSISSRSQSAASSAAAANCAVAQPSIFTGVVGVGIVSPDTKAAFPLIPELAARSDGSSKNDCETDAVKRLLPHIRASIRTWN